MTEEKKWVAVWGNAISITDHKPETYSRNLTLRYPIRMPFDGEAVRLTFDNYCGTEDVRIEKATVMLNSVFYPLYFNGERSTVIGAGRNIVTDPLPLKVRKEQRIFVSFYLKDFTEMRSSVVAKGPLSSGLYAVGDMTETASIPIEISRKTDIFYFLSNVSLLTDSTKRSIICYGDSITAQDWPDDLAMRMMVKGYNDCAVIRRAASGTRILRQYDNITYESYGLKGTNRFMHELPADGADTVIIQQGINDIIHPVGTEINPFRPMTDLPTANELIDGMKWYIEKAREMNLRVYVGTLLPIEGWRTYAQFREKLKNAFNDWIRTTDLIDGVIDFDMALRDPSDPAAFLPEYNSGDNLHPSAAGYRRMADEVPEEILK